MRAFLFDDHSETYLRWWDSGLRGLTCLHVDAHLDLMEDGFNLDILSELRAADGSLELEIFRREDGPHGALLHCANYLYPALRNELVNELYWIVPDHLWDERKNLIHALELVGHWVDVPLSDLRSWELSGDGLTGTLFDKPFWLGRVEDLPVLSPEQQRKLALDIDVDYFIDPADDSVWRTPYELAALIPYEPTVLTVALSVAGGYTPVQELFWGDLCLQAFQGESSLREFALRVWRSSPESWERLTESAPSLFRPALLARQGRWEEAQSLDRRYQVRPQDTAARFLETRKYREGLEYLRTLAADTLERDELIFYCLCFLERWDEVVELVQSNPGLIPERGPEALKMKHLLSQAQVMLGCFEKASTLLRAALRQAPENAALWLDLGLCEERMGAYKKAARSLQKAIRYSKGRASSASVLERSLPIFESLGERHLAASARRELNLLRRS